MDLLRTTLLILATLSTGLMAGAYAVFAHAVLPGLRRTDDRTFVGAFQEVDRAILNPWFLGGCFLGAIAGLVGSTVTHLGRDTLPWVATALGLYLVSVVVTVVVNVPRNDALRAAGAPDQVRDLRAAREAFDEGRWHRWNLLRTWTSLSAFTLLLWALVLHGATS